MMSQISAKQCTIFHPFRFNNDPSIDILLLTTHVGGLGLNLTGADTVIFVEHDWNPMKDLQVLKTKHVKCVLFMGVNVAGVLFINVNAVLFITGTKQISGHGPSP